MTLGQRRPLERTQRVEIDIQRPGRGDLGIELPQAARRRVARIDEHLVPAPQPFNPAGARQEKVVEAYWSWTLLGGWLLTPSVQYVRDPALAPDLDSAWALSLRATLML